MRKSYSLVFLALLLNSVTCEESCPGERKERKNKLFEQDFGLTLTPNDFLTSMFSPFSSFGSPWLMRDYIRPWRRMSSLTQDLGSTIKSEKDKLQINLDVQHFAPNEITVKTADGYILVEGKHEEKEDEHGFVSRHFLRRYALPEGTNPESVVSELSADGVLTVTAPRKPVESNERIVPITQTGPIRKEHKECNEVEGSCPAKGN